MVKKLYKKMKIVDNVDTKMYNQVTKNLNEEAFFL